MSVEQIMTKSIITVEMDDSLEVVREIFDNARFHHLLVVESGKVVGVVSDRDLLKAISPNIGTAAETRKDTATLNKKVHQVMTRKPFTLMAEARIHEAVVIFNNNNVSCIPIVDEEHKPVGIITWRDMMKVFGSSRYSQPENAN